MKEETKNKLLITFATIALIFSLIIIGIYLYENVLKENKKEEKEHNNYEINDYLIISDYEIGNGDIVKEIKFKNIPEQTTREFLTLQDNFFSKYRRYDDYTGKTVFPEKMETNINYEINDNVLSVYVLARAYSNEYFPMMNDYIDYEYYVNIDLKTGKTLLNRELLEIYGIKEEDFYEELILDTLKDYDDEDNLDLNNRNEYIKVKEVKENINNYAKKADKNKDITMYIKNNKITISYSPDYISQTFYDVILWSGPYLETLVLIN